MGFTGAYTDENGLVYLHNRYYDPATGQFISQDPINGQVGGTSGRCNPYSYGLNNPVNTIDPDSCEPISVSSTIALMLVSALVSGVTDYGLQRLGGCSHEQVDWGIVAFSTVLGGFSGGIGGVAKSLGWGFARRFALEATIDFGASTIYDMTARGASFGDAFSRNLISSTVGNLIGETIGEAVGAGLSAVGRGVISAWRWSQHLELDFNYYGSGPAFAVRHNTPRYEMYQYARLLGEKFGIDINVRGGDPTRILPALEELASLLREYPEGRASIKSVSLSPAAGDSFGNGDVASYWRGSGHLGLNPNFWSPSGRRAYGYDATVAFTFRDELGNFTENFWRANIRHEYGHVLQHWVFNNRNSKGFIELYQGFAGAVMSPNASADFQFYFSSITAGQLLDAGNFSTFYREMFAEGFTAMKYMPNHPYGQVFGDIFNSHIGMIRR